MAKGGRRQYTRDSRGRFSSSGSSRQGRPPAQRVKRGTNRLTRDNAGRITSVGGEGATARGGRLRTAGGKLRATQTARLKGAVGRLRKPVGGGGRAPGATPTAGRGRRQAAAAQRRRTRKTINATESQLIGFPHGVTATAGGGQRIKIKKATTMQAGLLGGVDRVTKSTVARAASARGPAPGSRAARKAAGLAARSKETEAQRMKRTWNRAAGHSDINKSKDVLSITERRRSKSPYAPKTSKKIKQSTATQQKATEYLYSRRRSLGF